MSLAERSPRTWRRQVTQWKTCGNAVDNAAQQWGYWERLGDNPGDFQFQVDETFVTRHSDLTKPVELPEAQHQHYVKGNRIGVEELRQKQESELVRNLARGRQVLRNKATNSVEPF